jgi:hypothetical protein
MIRGSHEGTDGGMMAEWQSGGVGVARRMVAQEIRHQLSAYLGYQDYGVTFT